MKLARIEDRDLTISTLPAPACVPASLAITACRAVASEIHAFWSKADSAEMIDTGSYRLSGSGKQPGRRKVPYKGSDLHITTVLDNACEKISDKFVRFEEHPHVFVERTLQEAIVANTTGDCKPVRALNGICSNLVDEMGDELLELLRGRTEIALGTWTDEFCGKDGIVKAACVVETDPGTAHDLVNVLKSQQESSSGEKDVAGNATAEGNVNEKAPRPEVAPSLETGESAISKDEL